MLIAVVFAVGAQNFSKEYPFWNSVYGSRSQFVYTYSDGYATVGIKEMLGYYSIALIRTDLKGDTLFTKTLLDTISNPTLKRSGSDLDGCHYLTFRKNDSACIARFSPSWDLQWIRKFGITHFYSSLTITLNNDVLFSGTEIKNGDRLHLYRLSSSGNTVWQKSIITQYTESPIKIMELENGNICIPVQEWQGYLMDYYDLNIYYFSATGDSLSYKSVPLNGMWSSVRQIITNNDTLAIIYSTYNTQDDFYYLMHIGTDGAFISEKKISLFDSGYAIFRTLLTPDHRILATGIKVGPGIDFYTTFIYAMTFNGDSLWSVDYGNNYEADVSDIQLCPDGGYIVSGNYGNTVNTIVTLIKTDSLGNLDNLGREKHSISDRVSVYPNPANEYVVFELPHTPISTHSSNQIIFITDIYGRPVDEVRITGEKTVWETRSVTPGVYLYQINHGKYSDSGKILIVK